MQSLKKTALNTVSTVDGKHRANLEGLRFRFSKPKAAVFQCILRNTLLYNECVTSYRGGKRRCLHWFK